MMNLTLDQCFNEVRSVFVPLHDERQPSGALLLLTWQNAGSGQHIFVPADGLSGKPGPVFFERIILMSKHFLHCILLSAATLALVGCASGVSRQADSSGATPQLSSERISKVVVRLSPEAQSKAADNPGFSTEELASVIRNQVDHRNMLDSASPTSLDVEVKDFRVRSTAAAILFGFMAGNDNVSGDVRLRGPNGDTEPFTVSASYALGGLAGGQDGIRMRWLYEEFAKLVAAELYGESK
ncbi:hypothetical protein [Candidatus Accumulibacter vicinus]|nr:hypothetical protein [Candidatus Accumulibacter vicinus]